MKIGYIYTLAHPITNEIVYIGKTINSLEFRLYSHVGDSKRHTRRICTWISKLNKQGLKPKIEELESADINDLPSLEKFYIGLFKTWGFQLKNHTEGGEGLQGFHHSESTRKLKSEQCIGQNNPFYGRKHSLESKDKMAKAHKGIKMSEAFSKNRSEYMLKNPLTQSTRLKIAESNKIRIVQLDMNHNLIATYSSAREACDKNPGYSTGHIASCCKGNRNSHKNFIWRYEKDYIRSSTTIEHGK